MAVFSFMTFQGHHVKLAHPRGHRRHAPGAGRRDLLAEVGRADVSATSLSGTYGASRPGQRSTAEPGQPSPGLDSTPRLRLGAGGGFQMVLFILSLRYNLRAVKFPLVSVHARTLTDSTV